MMTTLKRCFHFYSISLEVSRTLLYSIGNKGKDNGGEIGLNHAGHIDTNKSDWVW